MAVFILLITLKIELRWVGGWWKHNSSDDNVADDDSSDDNVTDDNKSDDNVADDSAKINPSLRLCS